jgi:hypothetical protein
MLPSRAAGDEVRFECNVRALAIEPSQRLMQRLGQGDNKSADDQQDAEVGLSKLANFSRRIGRLKSSEARIVKRALLRIDSIAAIDQSQFEDLAGAILTAWEGGRLRDIIDQVAHMETMDAGMLVSVLAEHQVLSALHVAEAVKLKLDVVDGLRRRIAGRELENDIRDYIAANPWLISPEWETFQIERRIGLLVEDALAESGIKNDTDFQGSFVFRIVPGAVLQIPMRPQKAL